MIYSSFATAACCAFLGLQLHLKWGPNWLIAVNMYLFTTTYTFGAGTVPYVVMAEVFLPEVSSCYVFLVQYKHFCRQNSVRDTPKLLCAYLLLVYDFLVSRLVFGCNY